MLEALFKYHFGEAVKIYKSRGLGGGCINDVYYVASSEGELVVKVNNANKYPEMFAKEADGLTLLKEASSLRVPAVVGLGQTLGKQFLILEYIAKGYGNIESWERLGSGLAELHSNTQNVYGLDYDNYIGALPQSNGKSNSWASFLIEQRFKPQVQLAHSRNLLNENHLIQFKELYGRLEDLLVVTQPSLLHGDLWNGNVMFDHVGTPVIYDPAVYFGNNEIELAFTTLFGGFEPSFYKGYKQKLQLDPGWEERFILYNLYPMLVHLNLFGSSYLWDVESRLNKFT